MDYNPGLAQRPSVDKGGEDGIEVPDKVRNIAWQTRTAVPTEDESALADALQAIFAGEIYDLAQIVELLDRAGVRPPEGAARWTEAVFRAEMQRLGA